MALIVFALFLGAAQAQSQEMQVEEPEELTAPPIDPALDAGSWQQRKASPTLSHAQKAALEERRKLVESMTLEIREKREALENSGQEERADRIKDLENLILENGSGAQVLDRLEKVLEKQAAAQDKNLTKKIEQLEKKLEKVIEKTQEKLDKGMGEGAEKSKSGK